MASPREVRCLPAAELEALRDAVKRAGSQNAAARALGIHASTVSQALNGRYIGDVDAIAQRIRGVYMAESRKCPVMGDISAKHCLDFQARPLVFTNPVRVKLYRACKACQHRKGAGSKAGDE
ncbi:MAG: hypothetical protein QM702_04360 [Rubrivivax sp.]